MRMHLRNGKALKEMARPTNSDTTPILMVD